MDARFLLSLYSVYGAMSDDQGVMVSQSTTNLCLDHGNYGDNINVWECEPASSTQKWIRTDGLCLKHVATGLCATSSGQMGSKVFLYHCGPPCHKAAVGDDETIEFDQSGLCFDHGNYGPLVNLWKCEPTSSTQQWKMDCTTLGQQITSLTCQTPSGNSCAATFIGSSGAIAHDTADYCDSSAGGTYTAGFTFTQTHQISTTQTKGNDISASATLMTQESMEFLGVGAQSTQSFTVSYAHTWGQSKSQSQTTSTSVESTCAINMKPHSKEVCSAVAKMGTLKGDIVAQVVTKYKCGGHKTENKTASVTITQVPITASVSACHWHDVKCPKAASYTKNTVTV